MKPRNTAEMQCWVSFQFYKFQQPRALELQCTWYAAYFTIMACDHIIKRNIGFMRPQFVKYENLNHFLTFVNISKCHNEIFNTFFFR